MTENTIRPFVFGKWWTLVMFVVLLMPVAADLSPWPPVGMALRTVNYSLVLVGAAMLAVHGYRMRKSVWTAQSWRWFVTTVVLSLASVALMMTFAASIDAGSAWAGDGGTATRVIIGLPITIIGLGGAIVFTLALFRFATGTPDAQYDSQLARIWRRVGLTS